MRKTAIFALSLSALFLWGCDMSINRSQYLGDGERSAGMTSVNGSIHVGANCTVEGNCRTVNGRIEVGDGSRTKDLETVNGSIVLDENVAVDGNAMTVNGSVKCGAGSRLAGSVTTVNGSIELRSAVVEKDINTVNGDIRLLEKSSVGGDIVIKGRDGVFSRVHSLEIRIEGGSVVEGDIDVRDPERKVKVIISKDSIVRGKIRNAEVE